MPNRRGASSWAIPVGVIAVALILIVTVITQGSENRPGPEVPPQAGESQQPGLTGVERRDPDDLLAVGPVDAPIGLVVFSDYQCPYCAAWNHDTLPEMMTHVDAGDLRIEWRDVNVFGEASERAARASYAAALQDRYWDYHDALFEGGEKLPESQLTEEALIDLADRLGLDTDRFTTDLNSDQTRKEVERNASEGINLGVTATPAFILAGQPIVGAQPTAVFVDAVDAALETAGG